MELREVELRILTDIYEMDKTYGNVISYKQYDLGENLNSFKRNAFAECLLKLERLGYIFMEEGAINFAGINPTKYSVNAVGFLYKKIHISRLGIKLIEESDLKSKRFINEN